MSGKSFDLENLVSRGRPTLEAVFRRSDMVFPEVNLSRMGNCDAIVEVAGRDSVGAAVAVARSKDLRCVLPTVAFTGTEFGDLDSLWKNVERMRRLLESEGVQVEEPVVLGSPRWWRAVAGRFNTVLSMRYGSWHLCLGCHMYLHSLRIPLSRKLGIDRLVAGERLRHGGKEKVNQSPEAVEAYRKVAQYFGVRLELPLLDVDDEEFILSLVGEWREGEEQPSCVLSGNYLDLENKVLIDRGKLRAYLEDYLIPATVKIVSVLLDKGKVNYEAEVIEILENERKSKTIWS